METTIRNKMNKLDSLEMSLRTHSNAFKYNVLKHNLIYYNVFLSKYI